MADFLIRRSIRALATMLVVISLVFFATRLSGNFLDFLAPNQLNEIAKAELTRYFGLDESNWNQYLKYMRGIFQGDFGVSLLERRPVTQIYGERIFNTLNLFFWSYIFALAIGIPFGVIAALYRKTGAATGIMGIAFIGYATPNFVLAIFLILAFSFHLHWFPSAGGTTWVHFVMPAIALGLSMMASVIRFTRTSMLEVLSEDYLRTARAKGLSEYVVIMKHALRNASIPIVTILGLQIARIVGAVVIVEFVFSTKGIGELVVTATMLRDYPVLQFGVILWAALVIVTNFVVDLIYSILDPRIRVSA